MYEKYIYRFFFFLQSYTIVCDYVIFKLQLELQQSLDLTEDITTKLLKD